MTVILEVNNVKKIYKTENHYFNALDGVSFQLKQGQCLGIVGESGSGKSTLAKILTCLEPVTSGQVLFHGQAIQNLKGKRRQVYYQQVQMVFQDPQGSFDPRYRLYDSIMEALQNRKVSKLQAQLKIDELAPCLELDKDTLMSYPLAVSGGQCQRAALLRALVLNPELLILDEATSALDQIVQYQIIKLLSQLKRKMKLTIVFICHDLALTQFFCDQLIVMHQGKIVESGSTLEIMKHPLNEYTKQLLAAVL